MRERERERFCLADFVSAARTGSNGVVVVVVDFYEPPKERERQLEAALFY